MADIIQKIVEGGGITLTLLGMGTVFFCLSMLYLMFESTGFIAKYRGKASEPAEREQQDKAAEKDVKDSDHKAEESGGEVAAAIALALSASMAGVGHHAGPSAEGTYSSWRIAGRTAQHERGKFRER